MHKYLFILETIGSGFSAYVPDLPGCVATGETVEEVSKNIRQAIAFHLDGLREEGFAIPLPSSTAAYVEVQSA